MQHRRVECRPLSSSERLYARRLTSPQCPRNPQKAERRPPKEAPAQKPIGSGRTSNDRQEGRGVPRERSVRDQIHNLDTRSQITQRHRSALPAEHESP